jgi:DNA-binding transcriptional ArsR family regulator
MSDWHEIPALPDPLTVARRDDRLEVRLPEGPQETFRLLFVASLTPTTVDEVLRHAREERSRVFVSYRHATPHARQVLREGGVSFAGSDGRVFLRAPGILVDRDWPPRTTRSELSFADEALRNPFSLRASRVPRLMLLEGDRPFSVLELADATNLNHATVSRALHALYETALVQDRPTGDRRRRAYRLHRPHALLEAWLPLWRRRRLRSERWNIGAHTPDEALTMLTETAQRRSSPEFALGGLAGAALVRRAVDVRVWTTTGDLERLRARLHPEPARGGRGTLHVSVAPDPWTLTLAQERDGVRVADRAQLWLDCCSEGERALEAAEAIADVSGWA